MYFFIYIAHNKNAAMDPPIHRRIVKLHKISTFCITYAEYNTDSKIILFAGRKFH